MRLLAFILCLMAVQVNAQPLWRNFFTTNQNPRVTVVAGSNATVQASTVGTDQRIFTVNGIPTTGAITNGDTRNLQFFGGITNTSSAGFVGNGGQLTNVPFSFWTNYTSNPLDFTNLNGLAYGSGMYGMTSYWAYATAPGVGPIGIFYNGIDTNTVISTNGGSFYGAILDLSGSSTAPGSNQLVTASWVRNLFNVGASYYNTTNIDTGTNTDSASQYLYKYQSTIPISDSRTYSTTDFLTNNGYVGAVVTTNTFPSLSGSIVVNAYFGFTGGNPTPTLSIKPEIYISSDKTNWYNEVAATAQNIVWNSTNLYQWLVDFPSTAATNAAGFYVQRRFKVVSTAGNGTARVLRVFVGTNAVSGTADAAHLTMQSPTATAGNAYLANNQVFTGSNYFAGGIGGVNYATNAGTAANVISSGSNYLQTVAFKSYTNWEASFPGWAIMCWGDSLTAGSGNPTYPAQLATLLSRPVLNKGVGSETSTQIAQRMCGASNAPIWGSSHIIWAGHNDFADTNAVFTNIAAMVALNPKRYVVLPILNSTNNYIGTANYSTITNLNRMLLSAYGTNHYFDYKPLLQSLADGSGADSSDTNNDCIPASLRADSIHLNVKGQTNLANFLAAWLPCMESNVVDRSIMPSDVKYLFKDTNNPALQIGDSTRGYLRIGDFTLSKVSGSGLVMDSIITPASDNARGLGTASIKWGYVNVGTLQSSKISGMTFQTDGSVTASSFISPTNGVVFAARDTIPTNSIPASTAANTNWVLINWTNTGPVFVATNTAAAGSFLLRVPTTTLSTWP